MRVLFRKCRSRQCTDDESILLGVRRLFRAGCCAERCFVGHPERSEGAVSLFMFTAEESKVK